MHNKRRQSDQISALRGLQFYRCAGRYVSKSTKKKLAAVALPILFCMSLFYLFVVPVIAILKPDESPIFGIIFGLFMLAQLMMLNLELGYVVVKSFYQIDDDKESLFFGNIFRYRKRPKRSVSSSPASRPGAVVVCFVCYLITIYVFAVGYMYISGFDNEAFNTAEQLGIIDSVYFSLITATTVGYGDIHPVSYAAKIMAMSEIIIGLLYVVVMFSSISDFLKRETKKRESTSSLDRLRGYRLDKHLTSQSTSHFRRRRR